MSSAETTILHASSLVLAVAFIAGCRESTLPATSEVKGVITYKGQPVKNGQVVFHPEGTENSGRGVTDELGQFVLSTYTMADGAVLGMHKVTVEVLENSNQAEPLNRIRARSPIPLKYADLKLTPLKIEVRQEPNEVELQLTD